MIFVGFRWMRKSELMNCFCLFLWLKWYPQCPILCTFVNQKAIELKWMSSSTAIITSSIWSSKGKSWWRSNSWSSICDKWNSTFKVLLITSRTLCYFCISFCYWKKIVPDIKEPEQLTGSDRISRIKIKFQFPSVCWKLNLFEPKEKYLISIT